MENNFSIVKDNFKELHNYEYKIIDKYLNEKHNINID